MSKRNTPKMEAEKTSIEKELQTVLDKDACLVLDEQVVASVEDDDLAFGTLVETDEFIDEEVTADTFDDTYATYDTAVVLKTLDTLKTLAGQLRYCIEPERKTLLCIMTHLTMTIPN